jgi:hypothetical protein
MISSARMTPFVTRMIRHLSSRLRSRGFPGSAAYWETRYTSGGHSGVGSYGHFAAFKAELLNDFVARHDIRSIIEFGCGDGAQLDLAKYPRYRGYDVSPTAIAMCRRRFATDSSKSFAEMSEYRDERAELTLSLDVIYHLVEDHVFEAYMSTLFHASRRHVVIYSSNDEGSGRDGTHVRHRKFTDWIASRLPEWTLVRHVPNRYPYRGDYLTGSFADFYIFGRQPSA